MFWHVLRGYVMAIELRGYQQQAIEASIREQSNGIHRQLIVLPTGTGKTILFAGLTHRLNKRTLILAHRDELIQQAVAKLKLYWPEVDIGIVKAELSEYDHQVVVGSVQSCISQKRIKLLQDQGFEVLIIDEAHHAASKSYQRLVKELGFLSEEDSKLLLGLTATPDRADNLGLGDTFEKIVFSRSIATMIKQGYLCPVSARRCLTSVSLKGIKTRMGDFQLGQLSHAVNIKERNEFIVEKYQQYANKRRTVAFCVDVQHCHDLADTFNEHGITAKSVWGDMPLEDRRQTLQELATGAIDVCTSCNVLTEGFDEPSVNCILMARPTKSRSLYTQCIGRGLRTCIGKTDCLVIDFSDQGHNLNTVMTLRKTMPDCAVELVEKEGDQEQDVANTPKNLAVTEIFDDLFDILGKQAFLWIDIGDNEYSLMDDHFHEIVLSPVSNQYPQEEVRYTATLWHNCEPTPILEKPLPLAYAQGIAEDYARQHLTIKFCESTHMVYHQDTLLPSEKQCDFLTKNGISVDNVTRAQAAVAIRKVHAVNNKKFRAAHAVEQITDKQRYYLERHGVRTTGMSKATAIKHIALLKQGIPFSSSRSM